MSLLKYLLKETEFRALAQFASPGFFAVVPFKQSMGCIAKAIGNSRDDAAVAKLFKEIGPLLSPSGIRISSKRTSKTTKIDPALGGLILRAYFSQILHSERWILDFTSKGWSTDLEGAVWSPASYWFAPSPDFLRAVRSLYLGFYRSDAAEFDFALGTLGLAPAKKEILAHFGLNGQHSIKFSLKEFQANFANVFEACRLNGSRIHPEFAILGAMLVSLYEALEETQAEIDVRKSFELADSGFASGSK